MICKDEKIREFRESEIIPVLKLIYRTIDVCYPEAYSFRVLKFFKEYHSVQKILERHRKGTVLIVEQKGRIVATGAVVAGEILGVFVQPEYQKQGLGRKLMLELENRAEAQGFPETRLSVSLPSKKFYENLGYEILENCSIDAGNGEKLHYWQARKKLA